MLPARIESLAPEAAASGERKVIMRKAGTSLCADFGAAKNLLSFINAVPPGAANVGLQFTKTADGAPAACVFSKREIATDSFLYIDKYYDSQATEGVLFVCHNRTLTQHQSHEVNKIVNLCAESEIMLGKTPRLEGLDMSTLKSPNDLPERELIWDRNLFLGSIREKGETSIAVAAVEANTETSGPPKHKEIPSHELAAPKLQEPSVAE